MWYRVGWAAPL